MPTAAPPYLEVIDSFAIRRTRQFFLIGRLHGTAAPGMFAYIQLNSSLNLTVRIRAIEEVVFTADNQPYTLLEMHEEELGADFLDLMLGFNISLENVHISGTN